ncbi:hypothetical protein [Allonocardiopsis opalescens]|uniref:DUF4190 domain-containing protein n=1 Tax=Allonocardiopsis opalescens TaxID=1144618 RepID=A0A2T0PSK3_9ACTN|nr:hypothetical protein [Allonocardiopsis opalescens]PRX91869.1 hypothetical protein CLV72_11354 [Allonocardiopsis opalescens]
MSQTPTEPRTTGQPPAVDRGGLWALLLSLAGLLLPPYGVVLSVLGIYQGRKARLRAKDEGTSAPWSVASMVLGAVGVLWAAMVLGTSLLIWDENAAWQQCLSQANTVSATEDCNVAFRTSIEERFGLAPGSFPYPAPRG